MKESLLITFWGAKALLILIILGLPLHGFAQDKIMTKDDRVISAYNLDIGSHAVFYTVGQSPESETKRIALSDIAVIKKADGTIIDPAAPSASASIPATSQTSIQEPTGNQPVMVPPHPAADNQDLIARYNSAVPKHVIPNKKENEKAGYFDPVYGILPSSVMSDSVITIALEEADEAYYTTADAWFGDKCETAGYYKIKVTNKTDNNVYVDLTNSFRINDKGEAEPFFDNKTVTHSSNSGSGGSLNLGSVTGALGIGGVAGTLASGVNVGGGSSSGTTVSESQNPVIIIPPKMTIVMPQRIVINKKGNKSTKNYERLRSTPSIYLPTNGMDKNSKVNKKVLKAMEKNFYRDNYYESSEVVEFLAPQFPHILNLRKSENETPTIARIITYSTDPGFKKYSSVRFDIYTRGYLGTEYGYGKKTKKTANKYCLGDFSELTVTDD